MTAHDIYFERSGRDIKENDSFTEGITRTLKEYLTYCAESEGGARFPNVAGFCHYAGILPAELLAAARDGDRDASDVLLVLEDEALNFDDLPASLASAYLKQHMGYGTGKEPKEEGGKTAFTFEHDIYADGE